jgi:hypothetical protein
MCIFIYVSMDKLNLNIPLAIYAIRSLWLLWFFLRVKSIPFILSSKSPVTVPHAVLLQLHDYGLSAGYVNWFRSYLTYRSLQVRYYRVISSPYVVLSGEQQRSVLGSVSFSVLINGLCNVVRFRSCLLYSDDVKIFREIISSHGSFLLQFDINSICRCWNSEYTKLNINNTRAISFSRAANVFGACKNCVITRLKIGKCVLQNQTSFSALCWLHISPWQLDFGFNSVVKLYFSSLESLLMQLIIRQNISLLCEMFLHPLMFGSLSASSGISYSLFVAVSSIA